MELTFDEKTKLIDKYVDFLETIKEYKLTRNFEMIMSGRLSGCFHITIYKDKHVLYVKNDRWRAHQLIEIATYGKREGQYTNHLMDDIDFMLDILTNRQNILHEIEKQVAQDRDYLLNVIN